MNYSVNRCSRRDGADMENKVIATRAAAIKWGRRCAYFWVRNIKTRELVAHAAGAPVFNITTS